MNGLLYRSQRFVKRNSSTILTCVGGVGVVATSIMAVKATPKAMRLLEEAKQEKGEDLTKLEIVQVAGPAYIPAALVGVSTIACIFGANALNKQQQASLMSAYALLDNSYKDYKNKVNELYGEGANDEITGAIAKDKYDEDAEKPEEGKELFYDEFSGRYFHAHKDVVKEAEFQLNRDLSRHGGVYLNEYFEVLGLPETDYGDYLGWSTFQLVEMYWESWLDFHVFKVVMDDGLECNVISMPAEPIPDFYDY
jgi:hypothetical protein